MTQWYYAQSGQQFGPLETSELVAYLRSGQLGPDTMVWTEGFSQWTAARDVPELASSPPAAETLVTPQVPPQFAETGTGDIPSGPQVRPWVRYWARMVDFSLFNYLCYLMLAIVMALPFLFAFGLPGPVYGMVRLLSALPRPVYGMVLLFAYIFLEPIMLSTWGTTPGKALLRVRVRNADGSSLTYPDGLNRTFKVWIRGVALGIPILALIAAINAYFVLTRRGITSWDQEGNFRVEHRVVGLGRVVATVVLLLVLFFVALSERVQH